MPEYCGHRRNKHAAKCTLHPGHGGHHFGHLGADDLLFWDSAGNLTTEIEPGQLWRHYKGRTYRVEGRCVLEGTLQHAVSYRSAELDDNGSMVWVRTRSNWREMVESGGRQVPRFRLIGHDDEDELSERVVGLAAAVGGMVGELLKTTKALRQAERDSEDYADGLARVHPDYLRHLRRLERAAVDRGEASPTDWEAPTPGAPLPAYLLDALRDAVRGERVSVGSHHMSQVISQEHAHAVLARLGEL